MPSGAGSARIASSTLGFDERNCRGMSEHLNELAVHRAWQSGRGDGWTTLRDSQRRRPEQLTQLSKYSSLADFMALAQRSRA